MNNKKLYISDENKLISGVCGGIAEHLNTDVTLVRIVFIIGTFVTGLWLGCLAYYLLTLIMPLREDGIWMENHSTKKVKNMFLYSLVVIVVYSSVLLALIYLGAILWGANLLLNIE